MLLTEDTESVREKRRLVSRRRALRTDSSQKSKFSILGGDSSTEAVETFQVINDTLSEATGPRNVSAGATWVRVDAVLRGTPMLSLLLSFNDAFACPQRFAELERFLSVGDVP
ncbi:MAG TPA: hypothetical protein VGG20_25975, partial [Thermoanaerobaculia bacterium]